VVLRWCYGGVAGKLALQDVPFPASLPYPSLTPILNIIPVYYSVNAPKPHATRAQVYYSRIVAQYNVVLPESLPNYIEPDIGLTSLFLVLQTLLLPAHKTRVALLQHSCDAPNSQAF
jgi:hypothetical protein